jgi:hypothetical protein
LNFISEDCGTKICKDDCNSNIIINF